MTHPVRVLRVIARLNAGGPAHHVGILSSRLDRLGYETLLAHGEVRRDEAALPCFAERYPCRRRAIPGLRPELRPWHDLRALVGLVRLVRAMRPEIVHTHTAKAGMLGRLAALAVRPRPLVVHTYHGHVLEGYFGPLVAGAYRLAERALARVSDRLISVSDATADDLVRLGVAPRERFSRIPLGLDLDEFERADAGDGAALREQLLRPGDDLLAVTIGRLVPVKRIDIALRAIGEATERGVRVRLAIVGEGPLRERLEHEARELGVGAMVEFLGARADIVALVSAADVILLSSDNEGTPVSLIEGAAAARPAVATAVGGVGEVITDATGRLVPARDWRALGAALAQMHADAEAREAAGLLARAHVLTRYGADRLLGDVDALYRELLASRDGGRP